MHVNIPHDRVYNSSYDMLGIVAELCLRRITLVYRRIARGNAGLVDLSARERAGIAAVREMDNRYRSGKYQHTQREMDQMAELCQALIVRHASTDARYECRPFRIDGLCTSIGDKAFFKSWII